MSERQADLSLAEIEAKVQARKARTYGGLFAGVVGAAFSFTALLTTGSIVMVLVGFGVALLGFGIVHPDTLLNGIREWRR